MPQIKSKPIASEFYSVAEAAARLRVSRGTIYNLMDRGELQFTQIGSTRTRRIRISDIDRLIEEWTHK